MGKKWRKKQPQRRLRSQPLSNEQSRNVDLNGVRTVGPAQAETEGGATAREVIAREVIEEEEEATDAAIEADHDRGCSTVRRSASSVPEKCPLTTKMPGC